MLAPAHPVAASRPPLLQVLVLGLFAVGVHGYTSMDGDGDGDGDGLHPLPPALLSAPTLPGAAAFFGIATFSFGVQMMVRSSGDRGGGREWR